MIVTTWTKWRNALGFRTTQASRRVAKARGNWGIDTERMESRALLSAAGGLQPVAAEVAVAHSKASFSYPSVAGNWTVTGDASGDATLTQTKNKVNATITAMGLDVSMKGKFTKAHPHELSGTAHVPNPITGKGKLAVKVHIEFGELSNPTTFTGEVTVVKLGASLNVSGTKV